MSEEKRKSLSPGMGIKLINRLNEIRMPEEMGRVDPELMRKFYLEEAWLILIRRPNSETILVIDRPFKPPPQCESPER